jgi:hypothetical protein
MEEAFFAPCTRMHDLIRAWNDNLENDGFLDRNFDFEEVELRAGAGNGAVNFLHFDDLWDLACRKVVVWLGPEIFITAGNIGEVCERLGYGPPLFSVGLDNDGRNKLHVYSRSATDATSTTASNCVFQLMTWNNTIRMHLGITALPSVSTENLSRFLNNSRSSGGTIRFENDCLLKLSQEQLRDYLRVFENSTGSHHRIELNLAANWSHFQIETVADFLQRCQCAIILSLFHCLFPLQTVPSLILDVLRGDCNVVKLVIFDVPDTDGLVRVLAENKTLVRLECWNTHISDDNWTVLCHSLSRHPKLEFLRLFCTFPCRPYLLSNERKTCRTNVFLKMLQANSVLQELDAGRYSGRDALCDEFDERILSDVIQPYLRRVPHVRAFGNNRGPGYDQLLASALYKVCDSPALVWTLIRSSIPTILESQEDN